MESAMESAMPGVRVGVPDAVPSAVRGAARRVPRFAAKTAARVVFALHVLLATACGDSGTGVAPDGAVSRIEIAFGAQNIPVGEATTMSATAYDKANAVVADAQWTWRSETPDVAIVRNDTVVGVSAGSAVITATTHGVTASRTLVVSSVDDVAILDARLTQGVQEPDQSIPIVLDGLPAVLNVVLRPRMRGVPSTRIVARFTDPSGDVVFEDTALVNGSIADRGFLQPTVQFLIPAQHLRFGLRWQVVRDPDGIVPDDSAHNDVFPRTGTRPLPIVEVPPLGVHLVPVRLASDGDATGTVSPVLIESYLSDVRRMLPIGKLDVTIGDTLVTTQSFGIKPTGGDNIFWSRLLAQLDAARMASAEHKRKHWIGFVTRPTGYTTQEFGGLGYKPTPWRGDGIGTRTSAVTAISVFHQEYVRAIIAHELGHNFGRSHAPCGQPSGVDPAYPFAGGRIDQIGHDVYSWSAGITTFARGVPTTFGDLMGYCTDRWVSSYTYRGVMEFRRLSEMVVTSTNDERGLQADAERNVPSVIVSGMLSDSNITVFPLEQRLAPPLVVSGGANRLELLDATGTVLYTTPLDFHATSEHGVQTFLHWIPLDATPTAARSVRIVTPTQRRQFPFQQPR